MLNLLGNSLSERNAHFKAVEERILAQRPACRDERRVSWYLNAARRTLIKPVSVGILGEINTGKTELANLILGIQVLPTSVINNTLCPTIVRYGEWPNVRYYTGKQSFEETDASELHRVVQKDGYQVECELPLPLLKAVELIDFPSFDNADLFSGHLSVLLNRSDILIWCSSSARPWTASERSAWLKLPARLKRSCLFVMTHADKLAAEALADVMERAQSEMVSLTNVEPIAIATTSAIEARSPRGQIMNAKLWNTSGGERFFKHLVGFLQNSLSKRKQRINDSANRFLNDLNGAQPGASDPLTNEWVRLVTSFEPTAEAPDRARDGKAAAEAIVDFKKNVCVPWLRSRDCTESEIDAFLQLLPETAEELFPKSGQADRKRLPLIFQQLTYEIQEYVTHINRIK